MDRTITAWINSPAGSTPVLDAIAVAVTTFGVPAIVLAVAVQWFGATGRSHVRHVCVAAGLSFLAGLALNQIILMFAFRPRPYDAGLTHLIVAPSADGSFPSDHATATFAVAAAFLLGGFRGRGGLLLAGALLVSVSRVYVGTHYLTDIIGGAATGAVAAVLVGALYREGTRLDRAITSML